MRPLLTLTTVAILTTLRGFCHFNPPARVVGRLLVPLLEDLARERHPRHLTLPLGILVFDPVLLSHLQAGSLSVDLLCQ